MSWILTSGHRTYFSSGWWCAKTPKRCNLTGPWWTRHPELEHDIPQDNWALQELSMCSNLRTFGCSFLFQVDHLSWASNFTICGHCGMNVRSMRVPIPGGEGDVFADFDIVDKNTWVCLNMAMLTGKMTIHWFTINFCFFPKFSGTKTHVLYGSTFLVPRRMKLCQVWSLHILRLRAQNKSLQKSVRRANKNRLR